MKDVVLVFYCIMQHVRTIYLSYLQEETNIKWRNPPLHVHMRIIKIKTLYLVVVITYRGQSKPIKKRPSNNIVRLNANNCHL